MPQLRDPFIWEVRDQVRDQRDLVLMTEPWTGRDQVMFIDLVSVINRGHSGGDVEIGVFQGGHFIGLETVTGLVVGCWTPARVSFTLLSKWQVYARFFYQDGGGSPACIDQDLCELHVVGYVLEPYSSP